MRTHAADQMRLFSSQPGPVDPWRELDADEDPLPLANALTFELLFHPLSQSSSLSCAYELGLAEGAAAGARRPLGFHSGA